MKTPKMILHMQDSVHGMSQLILHGPTCPYEMISAVLGTSYGHSSK